MALVSLYVSSTSAKTTWFSMLLLCRGGGQLTSIAPSSTFKWLRGSLDSVSPSDLPPDFDWRAYLKWNPELELQGIHTKHAAEEHYVAEGHLKSLVYRDFELTLRYTACGGLMNQHYCHIATIALAHLAKANKIIWPPMQVSGRCQLRTDDYHVYLVCTRCSHPLNLEML